jgi:hypothetical protein
MKPYWYLLPRTAQSPLTKDRRVFWINIRVRTGYMASSGSRYEIRMITGAAIALEANRVALRTWPPFSIFAH